MEIGSPWQYFFDIRFHDKSRNSFVLSLSLIPKEYNAASKTYIREAVLIKPISSQTHLATNFSQGKSICYEILQKLYLWAFTNTVIYFDTDF